MPKIPLTIEFANFAGEEGAALRDEDARLMSPLFERALTPPPNQMSAANVLFLYASFSNTSAPDRGNVRALFKLDASVRRIAEKSGAQILVVAMANSTEGYDKTLALPGPKAANLVLTLDRHGADFAPFFRDLFSKMSEGQDMLEAWVELAPQGPGQSGHLPSTVVLPEAGRVTFPRSNSW